MLRVLAASAAITVAFTFGSALADTVTVNNAFVMLDNVSPNPEGVLVGQDIFFGANNVTPNGANGTTGLAQTFTTDTHQLFQKTITFQGQADLPNMFARETADQINLHGNWLLSFTNGTDTTSVTKSVAASQQTPFVNSITVSGTGQNPVFSWTPPANTTVNGYRVNIYDTAILNANNKPSQIFTENLPNTQTSFTVPNTGNHAAGDITLNPGTTYYIEIQLLQTRDGLNTNLSNANIASRSRVFATFQQLPASAPPTVYLPVTQVNGSYQFNVQVKPGQTYYLDPSVASGYIYKTNPGDPNFASVTLPNLQANPYTLSYLDNGNLISVLLQGGVQYMFQAGGVDTFTVTGIDVALGLDPTNPTAFITGLTFVSEGSFTGTQTPITTEVGAPGPIVGAGLPGLLAGVGAMLAWYRKRRAAV